MRALVRSSPRWPVSKPRDAPLKHRSRQYTEHFAPNA
jgi:hypothetical protein